MSIEDDDNIEINFLRYSKKVRNKFIWPTVKDQGFIPRKEIISSLSEPVLDRRQGLLFNLSEIKPYLSTMH